MSQAPIQKQNILVQQEAVLDSTLFEHVFRAAQQECESLWDRTLCDMLLYLKMCVSSPLVENRMLL